MILVDDGRKQRSTIAQTNNAFKSKCEPHFPGLRRCSPAKHKTLHAVCLFQVEVRTAFEYRWHPPTSPGFAAVRHTKHKTACCLIRPLSSNYHWITSTIIITTTSADRSQRPSAPPYSQRVGYTAGFGFQAIAWL